MDPYVTPDNIEDKVQEWRLALERFDRPHITPTPGRTALLIVDMQKYFTNPGGGAFLGAVPAIVPRIKTLLERCRSEAIPVVFTRHVHKRGEDGGMMESWWKDLIMAENPESEIDERLEPRRAETVIEKNRYSAFYRTELEKILRSANVDTIVISGVMTNLCCESTARDAFFRDFKVFFCMDATATLSETMHFGSLLNLAYGFARITTVAELEEMQAWKRTTKQGRRS